MVRLGSGWRYRAVQPGSWSDPWPGNGVGGSPGSGGTRGRYCATGHCENRRVEQIRADVALVGGGGAAMALLFQLCRTRRDRGVAGAPLRVVVVDPSHRLRDRPQDRTWCYWERADPLADGATSALGPVVEHAWSQLSVQGPGRHVDVDLSPAGMRYAMVRSGAFYGLVAEAVRDPSSSVDVRWLTEQADDVEDGHDVARVRTRTSSVVATWLFDSRPPRPAPKARTSLLQHFRGVIVRTPDDRFDPRRAVLMDLTTAQPRHGLSFGYCLPLSADRALVEYTEFSRAVLDDAGYDTALAAYLDRVVGPPGSWGVEHTETGAIPMTDAPTTTRTGERVFRIGTAGGATRPSTGYTFAAMHRQARGVAALLQAGRVPVPPPAYPSRHRRLDSVLLRGLDTGQVDGTRFFPDLFARNPAGLVLDFLDGATTPAEELRVMRSVPATPMLRSIVRLAVP